MAKEKRAGSPPAFKEHSEKEQGRLNPGCNLKYSSEMGNPEDLDKNSAGLADYVKKNKMQY